MTKATIILRGSRAGTEDTSDMFEYWDGEVRFENLEIFQPSASRAAWAWLAPSTCPPTPIDPNKR